MRNAINAERHIGDRTGENRGMEDRTDGNYYEPSQNNYTWNGHIKKMRNKAE